MANNDECGTDPTEGFDGEPSESKWDERVAAASARPAGTVSVISRSCFKQKRCSSIICTDEYGRKIKGERGERGRVCGNFKVGGESRRGLTRGVDS